MYDVEESDLNKSLQKATKVCKVIRYVFIAASIVYALSLVISIFAVVLSGLESGLTSSIGAFIYVTLHGVLILAFLVTMVRIFSDVVKGSSPFSEKQANRLRLLAVFALALAILELVFTASVAYNVIPEAYSVGINDAYPADSVNLNVGMLVFSAIMYSLSALFRYAALMQQLVNDTV